jgi:hypothetical protein
MVEYNESSTSCSSGRSNNPTDGTNADQRGGLFGSDPTTILGGVVDINMDEDNSVPPLLSVVWDASLLVMWSVRSPSLVSPSSSMITDQQRSLVDVTLAMVEGALAILEDLDDPITPPPLQ